MIRKPIVLFFALLLPILIFVFLHYYGKNEFEVPVYFKSSSEGAPADCEIKYPYQVNENNFQLSGPAVILFASGLLKEQLEAALFQLGRLKNEFGDHTPKVFFLREDWETQSGYENEITLDKTSYDHEKKCVYMAGENQLVLVDSESRIRGFYTSATLKETDRLIVELKIIFKEY